MSAAVRRRRPEDFQIHQDGPSTEDTEMNTDAAAAREEEYPDEEDQEQDEPTQSQERRPRGGRRDVEEEEEGEPELDEDEEEEEEESDEEEILDDDMRRLQDAFPGFRRKYKLIKRIGEGMWDPQAHGPSTSRLYFGLPQH